MAVTVHKGVEPPITEESACAGYPRGVWPPVVSPFCVGVPLNQDRHRDCSLPGCTCPCHEARVKSVAKD